MKAPCYEIFFFDAKLFEVFVGRHSRSNGYTVMKAPGTLEIHLGSLYLELSINPRFQKR